MQHSVELKPVKATANKIVQIANSNKRSMVESNNSTRRATTITRRIPVILLTSVANKPESLLTALEKRGIVIKGVSKEDLVHLKEIAGLDYSSLSKALTVTKATLINKKDGQKFSADLSEKIVGLADIYSYGYSVFEDTERFNDWMHKPNQALGGEEPYSLVDSQFGREEVKDIIGRIEYGVFS